MKNTLKYKDCNEGLCFTPKRNCFHEFHYLLSMFIYYSIPKRPGQHGNV